MHVHGFKKTIVNTLYNFLAAYSELSTTQNILLLHNIHITSQSMFPNEGVE